MTLREARFKKKITQWELSKRAGVHQSRISLIENDFPVNTHEIEKISKALGIEAHSIEWPKVQNQ